MARVILVTGGSRSGKSAYALKLAEGLQGARAFIATAPITDSEMRERVRRHRQARRRRRWHTIEEPLDLAGAIRGARRFDVVLADCLTLWVNNLLYQAEQSGREIGEDDIAEASRELLGACASHKGTVVFVTNEVGMGIVPDNALARRFRDMVGRCNQAVAAGADTVTLVACGLPLHLKGG